MPIYIGIFAAGLIAGILIAMLLPLKRKGQHELQMQLQQCRKELTAARRALQEFFKHEADLREQLSTSYAQYISFIDDGARRLSAAAETDDKELPVPAEPAAVPKPAAAPEADEQKQQQPQADKPAQDLKPKD